ncbi:Rv1157c family protein [Mycolicibacterium thermoresistibile]
MSSTRTLVALGSSAALLLMSPAIATAQPAPPSPVDGVQAPGLSAVQELAPAIQDAASDPTNAASMLMAAAAMFTGNAEASPESRNVASAVNEFVSQPATPVAHTPAAGAVPGTHAHLPPGVNPAHAVGPLPAHAPEVPEAPVAAPAPAPAAAPAAHAAAPVAVPAPAPEAAAPPPVPDVPEAAAPAPAPAPSPEASGPNTAPPGFAPDSPPTQEFMYPSISNGCLSDGGNVLATAISVAGPANIPTPGPGPGQTAYVFTAVGTPGPAEVQKLPLNVTWVNLSTGKSGSATLKPRNDINPEGPTTLTAIVDTGSGSIMSTIFGQVTTTEKQCQFMPTIGSTVVP